MIVDDSIAEKPHTDENDIVCWHYDHSQERTAKGITVAGCRCRPVWLYQAGSVETVHPNFGWLVNQSTRFATRYTALVIGSIVGGGVIERWAPTDCLS